MMISGVGRRQFIRTVLSGAVLGAATQAGPELTSPQELHAQTSLSPDEALHELLAGNQLTSITHNLIIMKERTVNKQERLWRYWPVPILVSQWNWSLIDDWSQLSHASRRQCGDP